MSSVQSQILAELLPDSLHLDQPSARTPPPEPQASSLDRIPTSSLYVQTAQFKVLMFIYSAGTDTFTPIHTCFIFPPGDLMLLQLTANHSRLRLWGCKLRSCPLLMVLKCIIHQLFSEMLTAQFAAGIIHPVQYTIMCAGLLNKWWEKDAKPVRVIVWFRVWLQPWEELQQHQRRLRKLFFNSPNPERHHSVDGFTNSATAECWMDICLKTSQRWNAVLFEIRTGFDQ